MVELGDLQAPLAVARGQQLQTPALQDHTQYPQIPGFIIDQEDAILLLTGARHCQLHFGLFRMCNLPILSRIRKPGVYIIGGMKKQVTHRNHPVTGIFFLILSAFSLATAEAASVKFVSDQFKVTMRSGMATDHKIISMLPSGHRLEVLGEDDDKGYSKVRNEEGKVGYVLTRYLMDEPSAREQLTEARERLEALRQAPDQLAAELDELKTSHAQLVAEHEQVAAEKNRIEQELADFRKAFAEPVKVARERDELRQQLAGLIRQSEELKQEKRELENSSEQMWFLIGGGTIIAGIFLGLILPYFRTTRRSSSWSSL